MTNMDLSLSFGGREVIGISQVRLQYGAVAVIS